MPEKQLANDRRNQLAKAGAITGLVLVAILMIFCYAPTEVTMGQVQRILYLHVSVAWCGLAGLLVTAGCGIAYLIRRQLQYDHWAQASAEIGWLTNTLTLATGSLWAHEAWNVWWTWEPRLTSSLVLWFIYAGYFLLRSGVENPHHRARLGAVLAVLGVSDVPLVLMSTRWFRGVHPVTPEMDPQMRLVLLVAAISFTVFFAYVVTHRRQQLTLLERIAALENSVDGR